MAKSILICDDAAFMRIVAMDHCKCLQGGDK